MAIEQEVVKHGVEIHRLRKDLDGHTEDNKENFDKTDVKIQALQTRLPNWAVFLISGLMGILGIFGTLAAKGVN